MASHQVKELRRKIMWKLTSNIGKEPQGAYDPNLPIKRILIVRPNQRLGNLLLITPLIKEVRRLFPGCEIDIFLKGGLGPIAFKNYDIRQFISLPKKPAKQFLEYIRAWKSVKRRTYDLAINVDHNSSSGRIAVNMSDARYKFFGEAISSDIGDKTENHIAKYPVINLRNYLRSIGMQLDEPAVEPIDIMLSEKEIALGKETLDRIVDDASKKTISIFTYATGTKCYSKEWWGAFYERLKAEFPQYNIIEILPVENVSQIDFKANVFYSKDVREIGALMHNTACYIGADSGIMHLASASMTKTIGLFAVTNIRKYIPYCNGSIGINTNEDSLDEMMAKIRQALS